MKKNPASHYILLLVFLLVGISAGAQNNRLNGIILDSETNQPLAGVNIVLRSLNDSTKVSGASTDLTGKFSVKNLNTGDYRLRASIIGYKTVYKVVRIEKGENEAGTFRLEKSKKELSGVTVEDRLDRAVQKGDTTEYNAKGYKVNKDATAEDLITKMPGITNENGVIKAQGEEVKKVTVDGQEFFGDDATMALKNLPAEMVDRIQVFDRMSDQAQFTGFDDGNSMKTINIITANGKNKGVFGKLYGGYGYLNDHRYMGGGNINIFRKKQRITILGLSNNINQQNFSSQDLLGVSSASQSSQRGGGGPFGMGMGRGGGGGPGGWGGGGNASNNFLTGSQGGINTTHSAGINYNDSWGKKINVQSSYFFNNGNNVTESDKRRTYFLTDTTNQYYNETSESRNSNYNHRFNMRLEYNIDTSQSIIFTPRYSYQRNSSTSKIVGSTLNNDSLLLSNTSNNTNSDQYGYNLNNSLLYRVKFKKAGRTFSINLGADYSYKSGNGGQMSNNQFFQDTIAKIQRIDQRNTNGSDNYNLSANLMYTEPVSKAVTLSLMYNPSYVKNSTFRETNALDTATGQYSILNTVLSNRFSNRVMKQNIGPGFRVQTQKMNIMFGLNYQYTTLQSDQLFPVILEVNKVFHNILPGGMFMYRFSKTSNLRIFFRSSTNVPSATQLQNIVDNSNPLQLSSGNPTLKQEFSNSLTLRYNLTKSKKGHSLGIFLNGVYTDNYIGNSTFIATKDTLINSTVLLREGSQLSQPVNLKGYGTANTSLNYGIPLRFMKCNLNINAGVAYSRTPALINTRMNYTNSLNTNGGIVLSSNISEKVDFTLSYSANYNFVQNTLQSGQNNNFFYQLSSFRFNWLPWKGLVLNTNLNHTYYTGLGNGFNLNFLLWNASIGYKVLKDKSLEFRVSAFDLLNQNNSISRTVYGNYVEDNRTRVLNRYFMVGFTYNIRYYKPATKPK
jgi:hypothetical protein